MSLCLPRPLLARSCSRSIYTARSHLIVPRSFPSHKPLLLSRYQSTKSAPAAAPTATPAPDAKTGPPATPKEPALPLSTRVWKKVKHEAQHYWHGTKLLVSEVRISSRLQWKILQGDTLTRRERRQVIQNIRASLLLH